jgi:hypothetical protein
LKSGQLQSSSINWWLLSKFRINFNSYERIKPIRSDRAEEIWNKAFLSVQKLEYYILEEKPLL